MQYFYYNFVEKQLLSWIHSVHWRDLLMKKVKLLAAKFLVGVMLLAVALSGVWAADAGSVITVYLAGDSTVKSYGPSRGEGGWGEFLQYYFNTDKVVIVNKSEGGRSSRSFINEGRLRDIENQIKPGDYLFIQFGHNDCAYDPVNRLERYTPVGISDANGIYPVTPGTLVETPDELIKSKPLHGKTYYAHDSGGTFKWFLKHYIEVARAKGAIPVLVTPVSRMYFSGAMIKDHHDDNTSRGNAYVTAVKQLAAEENVLCIDMFEITKAMYERMGEAEASKLHFVKNNGSLDKTHYNKCGGFYVGGLMAQEVKKANISISSYVLDQPSQTVSPQAGK